MPIKLPFRPRRETYPDDLWTKCPSCTEMLFNKQLDKAMRVCPNCSHHFRLGVPARLDLLLDPDTFVERDAGLESVDPLTFVDQKPYPDRLAAAQLATGLRDALVWGTGALDGRRVAIGVMDFAFMGGSMGAVVGEKVTRAAEAARSERLPLIIVSASGGARMQEGTLALMQLVKTVAAIERLRAAGLPYLSVLTDPTTGGVFASFSVLGDVNLAEPDALIGFAGARVQAGTIAQELPPGFQRAEFLFRHGFVDRVVPRAQLRGELIALLRYLAPPVLPGEAELWAAGTSGSAFKPFSDLFSALADKVTPEPADSASRADGKGARAESIGRMAATAPRANGRTPRGSGRAPARAMMAIPDVTATPTTVTATPTTVTATPTAAPAAATAAPPSVPATMAIAAVTASAREPGAATGAPSAVAPEGLEAGRG